jgi:tRNA(Ser,Leu) C12 N-acetylase TAN1
MKIWLIVTIAVVTIVVHICIAMPIRFRTELVRVEKAIPSGARIAIAQGDTFAVILVNKESEFGSEDEKTDKIKLNAMLSALLQVSQKELSKGTYSVIRSD